MRCRDDRSAYSFGKVDFELRVWDDPAGGQPPVFLVEVTPESGAALRAGDREALARSVCERINKTPDQVIWLEQTESGDLTRYEFAYSHTQRLIPDAYDMDAREAEEAAKRGQIASQEIRHYNARAFAVSPEEKGELQERTEDPLRSRRQDIEHRREAMEYNEAQEADLSRATMPAASVAFDELNRLTRDYPHLTH